MSDEIRRHGTVGAVIALFLTAAELLQKRWNEFVGQHGTWLLVLVGIVLLAIAFLGAFGLIALIESVWRHKQERKPIPVGDIGFVNGVWIDAIIKDKQIERAAKITISSTVATGFSVYGKAFEVTNEAVATVSCGSFNGRRGTLLTHDSVTYKYGGADPKLLQDSRDHSGIVYYQFHKGPNGRFFTGAFWRLGVVPRSA